jgi:exonuclease III
MENKNVLTVAQCNLLHHVPYEKYNKGTRMSELDRDFRFHDYFDALVQSDVLALQEWALDDNDKASLRFQALIRDLYEVHEFRQNSYMGCAIAVNTDDFSVLQVWRHNFKCGNGFVCVVITQEFGNGEPIGIISMHLPFGKLEESLAEVRAFQDLHSGISKWVICGDCNSNKVDVMLKSLKDLASANTLHIPTHRSGSDRHEEYDFVFHSTDLCLTKPLAVIPEKFDDLLSHTVPQVFTNKTFFSDHAILRASFKIMA